MATLERKRAYVAEQQRQLASMVKEADQSANAKRVRLTETGAQRSPAPVAPPWAKRIANASVTPPAKPWTHWTCSCVVRSTHPVAHDTCHRCGASQQVMEREALARDRMVLQPKTKVKAVHVFPPVPDNGTSYKYRAPPGPPPITTSSYVPPKHIVVTLAPSTDDNPSLDGVLQARVNSTQIFGPAISVLWKTLDNPTAHEPKLSMQTVQDQIMTQELQMTNAQKEILVAQTLSPFMQEAAKNQVKVIADQLLILREAAGVLPADKDITYAAIDRKRAVAVQNLQDWDARKLTKEEQMLSEVLVAVTAADDAIEALQLQKVALNERLKEHQSAWLTINGAHRQSQCIKILELEARCKETKAAEALLDDGAGAEDDVIFGDTVDNSAVSALQQMVTALQAQLASQVDVMAAADVKFKAMETHLASIATTHVDNRPTLTLSAKVTTAAGVDISPAVDESKGESKGKGKGSEHDHY